MIFLFFSLSELLSFWIKCYLHKVTFLEIRTYEVKIFLVMTFVCSTDTNLQSWSIFCIREPHQSSGFIFKEGTRQASFISSFQYYHFKSTKVEECREFFGVLLEKQNCVRTPSRGLLGCDAVYCDAVGHQHYGGPCCPRLQPGHDGCYPSTSLHGVTTHRIAT
jgi:hypothetical protein